MTQINLNATPEFEHDLEALMLWRGIRTKADAIRHAVREAADRYRVEACRTPQELFTFIEALPRNAFEGQAGAALTVQIEAAMQRLGIDGPAKPAPSGTTPGVP
jgi:hypothetical protein